MPLQNRPCFLSLQTWTFGRQMRSKSSLRSRQVFPKPHGSDFWKPAAGGTHAAGTANRCGDRQTSALVLERPAHFLWPCIPGQIVINCGKSWSGYTESNRAQQLGRLPHYHYAIPAQGRSTHSMECTSGGGDWIRTSVRKAGRFTVCWI